MGDDKFAMFAIFFHNFDVKQNSSAVVQFLFFWPHLIALGYSMFNNSVVVLQFHLMVACWFWGSRL